MCKHVSGVQPGCVSIGSCWGCQPSSSGSLKVASLYACACTSRVQYSECFGLQHLLNEQQYKAGSNESCTVQHSDSNVYSYRTPHHKFAVMDRAEFNKSACNDLLRIEDHLKLEVISSFIDAKVYLQMCRTFEAWAGRQYQRILTI